MARYILFLHERPDSFSGYSAADLARVIAEYRAWSESLRARDAMAGGEKLAAGAGRIVRAKGAEAVVAEGPYAENRELVGGFFIVNAASYDEAVALTRDCPHLRYGSAIEVREIEELE